MTTTLMPGFNREYFDIHSQEQLYTWNKSWASYSEDNPRFCDVSYSWNNSRFSG